MKSLETLLWLSVSFISLGLCAVGWVTVIGHPYAQAQGVHSFNRLHPAIPAAAQLGEAYLPAVNTQ